MTESDKLTLEELEAELSEKLKEDKSPLIRIQRIKLIAEKLGGGLKEERSSSVGKWVVGDIPTWARAVAQKSPRAVREPHKLGMRVQAS